jgi:hypothetical protein
MSSVLPSDAHLSRVNRSARMGSMSKQDVESIYVPDPGAPFHIVGSGLVIPAVGQLTVLRVPDDTKEVVFRVDLVGAVLRPTAVTVRSTTAEEITATDLRAVNVKTLWRAAIFQHVHYVEGRGGGDSGGKPFRKSPLQISDAELELMRLKGPEQKTLEYVADVYSLARTLGLAPALYVQEVFAGEALEQLPRTTATKWIKKARDLGLIHETGILADSLFDDSDRRLLRDLGFGEVNDGDD